jgi:agmatine deiminase
MLPEWAPQQAVMQPWLEVIQRDYVELAAAIATEVPPLILCQDQRHKALVEAQLQDRCLHTPRLVSVPYNDTWCRDYGPITVAVNGERQLLDFRFHGWGAKYAAALDNAINQRLAALWAAPLRTVDYELEGGSIESDGRGTLLTTTHCLCESNRNRAYSKAEVEAFVLSQLGMQRMLWLSEGALLGDDTDSHIDNLVRFCAPDTLAYATCSRAADPHFAPLQAMARQVQALRQPDGQPYRLHAIELPAPQFGDDGKRLPGSYVNFLIVNGSVIVPVFGCAEDEAALATLQQCFPGKLLLPVPGGNLIRQYGGPHCATMQLPVNTLQSL